MLKGIPDVMQPAAFKLAIVLRHTPSELTVKLLADLLHLHPQSVSILPYNLTIVIIFKVFFGHDKIVSDLSVTKCLKCYIFQQDLTAYVLALLTDDEAWCGSCGSSGGLPGKK